MKRSPRVRPGIVVAALMALQACDGGAHLLLDPATSGLYAAEGRGEGQGTHLSRFRVAVLDQPTVNLCSLLQAPPSPPDPEDVARSGRWEFVAADGSTLGGRYEFLFVPPDQGGFFTLIVEEDTRRFRGGRGELQIDEERNSPVVCDDPLGTVPEWQLDEVFRSVGWSGPTKRPSRRSLSWPWIASEARTRAAPRAA